MKKNLGFIIICCVAIFVGPCVPTPRVDAASGSGWEKVITAKVIDIDPIYYNSELGMMVSFEGGYWCQFWKNQLKSSWPGIGEYGTWYSGKEGGKHTYKWVIGQSSNRQPAKPSPKAKVKVNTPTVVSIDWVSASTLPEINKVVLIQFDDGSTSTAYVNDKSEWKLDMNRKSYNGGRTYINIVKWKGIDL
jgi:hypothetical protein